MRDLETGSLWSHILGEAMRGPLKGHKLEILPGIVMTWGEWRTIYPHTTAWIMERKPMEFAIHTLKSGKKYVYGVRTGTFAKAWDFDYLRQNPVIEESIDNNPIWVVHEKNSGFTRIYSRYLGNRELKGVEQDADRLTVLSSDGTRWDLKSGTALEGPLKREALTIKPGIISFASSWRYFFPESLYNAEKVPEESEFQGAANTGN